MDLNMIILIISFTFLLLLISKLLYDCFSNLFLLIWVILKFLILISLIFLITRIVNLDFINFNVILEEIKNIIPQNILMDAQTIYIYLKNEIKKFIFENYMK